VHVDNIAPSLYGGLVLTVGIDHPRVKQIPVPPNVRAVIVHPHMFLSTRQARAILKINVEMKDFVWQTANLAGFISGCYTNDLDMIRESFEDVVIEPQRAALIPGFGDARRAAVSAGALGVPTPAPGRRCFAWCLEAHALAVREAMAIEFSRHGLEATTGTSIEPIGARVRLTDGTSQWISSARNASHRVGFGAALRQDWRRTGLHAPVEWPERCGSPVGERHAGDAGARFLAPFAAGDSLAPQIGAISGRGVQLRSAGGDAGADGPSVLELFHGPTAAFKDFGARFLGGIAVDRRWRCATAEILVATSGDTGGAVAAAFHRRPGVKWRCCFPGSGFADRERQLTCWGDNAELRGARHLR
jgi:hypothetical protein